MKNKVGGLITHWGGQPFKEEVGVVRPPLSDFGVATATQYLLQAL